MTNKEFKSKVCEYISQYNTGNPGVYGSKRYKHILALDELTQKQAIIDYALIGDAKMPPYKFGKLHDCAHHLNSSQIVCYNYFRPFMDNINKLYDLCSYFNIELPKNLTENNAKFEYEDGLDKIDNSETSFDFHFGNRDGGLFCEIKYTESCFGNCKTDERHENKFEEYKKLLGNCPAIDGEISFKNFCEYYQLFRNVLRVKDNKNYSVSICPDDATYLKKIFYSFCGQFIRNKYIGSQIKFITWEQMIEAGKKVGLDKHMKEFETRYFRY